MQAAKVCKMRINICGKCLASGIALYASKPEGLEYE